MRTHMLLRVTVVTVALSASAAAQGRIDYNAAMNGAKVHYKGGRYPKAAALFRLAVNDRPSSADARYWLGLALAQIGRDSLLAAAGQFDTSFTLDTAYVARARRDLDHVYLTTRSLYVSAQARMSEADHEGALRFIRWAVALNPNEPDYYMTLGNIYAALDMTD
ncbi:MAG: tetratricopeptide repeat protein, partial [candidate division WOR-3 bacterium]